MVPTPFKLTEEEVLASAAATLFLSCLTKEGSAERAVSETCFAPQYGYTASASVEPCGPRFVRITDIRAGTVDWNMVPYCDCPEPSAYELAPGDILVARSGFVGKSFIVTEVRERSVFASYMIRLRAKPATLPLYLYWCLQSQQFWQQVMDARRGSAMKNINGRMLTALRFPYPREEVQQAIVAFMEAFRRRLRGTGEALPGLPPPLDEQRRIVARIEQLAAKIQEARGLRQEAAEQADVLVDQERAALFDEASKSGAVRLDGAATLERGRFSYRPRNEPRFFGGKHPWIQIEEIESSNKYIRKWGQTLNDAGLAISRKFPKGTLLVSIAATIGAVGILDFDCCVPDSIVAVTPKPGFDSEYVYHYLLYVRRHLEDLAPQSAQKNINLRILSPLPIPILPFSEQRHIVTCLDGLQAKVDVLKPLQAETAAELDALLPSVLDRAFHGEL